MADVQKLQENVEYWQRQLRLLADKQERIIKESREIGIEIEKANRTLQDRQGELSRAMADAARNPKH